MTGTRACTAKWANPFLKGSRSPSRGPATHRQQVSRRDGVAEVAAGDQLGVGPEPLGAPGLVEVELRGRHQAGLVQEAPAVVAVQVRDLRPGLRIRVAHPEHPARLE